jgi:hypothetical protein
MSDEIGAATNSCPHGPIPALSGDELVSIGKKNFESERLGEEMEHAKK